MKARSPLSALFSPRVYNNGNNNLYGGVASYERDHNINEWLRIGVYCGSHTACMGIAAAYMHRYGHEDIMPGPEV